MRRNDWQKFKMHPRDGHQAPQGQRLETNGVVRVLDESPWFLGHSNVIPSVRDLIRLSGGRTLYCDSSAAYCMTLYMLKPLGHGALAIATHPPPLEHLLIRYGKEASLVDGLTVRHIRHIDFPTNAQAGVKFLTVQVMS